jgi:hypothetical protein
MQNRAEEELTMPDTSAIRARMRELSVQAAQTIRRANAGTAHDAEVTAVVTEVDAFLAEAATDLLDAADQAAAAGDPCLGDEFYEIAMEIEEELLRGAPPVVAA